MNTINQLILKPHKSIYQPPRNANLKDEDIEEIMKQQVAQTFKDDILRNMKYSFEKKYRNNKEYYELIFSASTFKEDERVKFKTEAQALKNKIEELKTLNKYLEKQSILSCGIERLKKYWRQYA